ncbi:glyoxylate/hydroxypyruvate reductase HPR3-like [Abrus precatorius]|uniref:glyoxylate reductase (NADP(+)) n=1 Tax=Abrus precatorius TaxID=3816 RepID=A0A8B8K1V8_ABRPR|nr:glyoxylate/hydroxypyruvate reductase HPR3-like [Abrus precatorius]
MEEVLVLGLPSIMPALESLYSHKYKFLKLFNSKLSLLPFLQTQNVTPSSIRAILSNPLQALTADLLRLLPAVALIITTSVGTDHIDLLECRRRSIQVLSVREGSSADDVAEFAVGLLIDALCKISAADRHIRKCVSYNFPLPSNSKLGGKRVGIVGLGRIGGEVAKRLEAFDCRVMYHSRKEKPFVSYPFCSNVVELAGNSDILVVCCSLNEQTRHIINREVMLALGKDGVIVNVGRGALIDEKELVGCLMEREIRGAGLDVFENEPNVPKDLFALDNVVLTPHAASLTNESSKKKYELVAESLDTFFASKPPVTPE